ncbi:hypothetical protein [uncultured Campylobacter sp.]|uniref:hypothetical protein n=1 Tax=uncultured Campylobacter sp. TaxID=218934 RepID=UPI002615A204|nr:hypothetical protein [uncultured Campylobacter sp.]
MLFISPLHITNERRNSTAKILPERRQIKFLDKPVFKFCEIVDFKNFKISRNFKISIDLNFSANLNIKPCYKPGLSGF